VKVLVDTSIWSLAFRRKKESKALRHQIIINELKELINETRAVIIGPIRQEILSGISDEKQYLSLKEKLKAFDDVGIKQSDFELAAELYNICRKKGIQGSHIDFLICAVALQNNFLVFTDDKDFDLYSKILAIKVHRPRKINH
jgi:Predicted nucleic acid-binding protein, contains PIN domain